MPAVWELRRPEPSPSFETINEVNLTEQRKRQNVGRSYEAVTRRLHDAGAMVNASFVFGMDAAGRTGQVLRALPLLESTLNRFRQ